VIARVCRRAGVRDADAEDFASTVKLALIENDYAILRSYEGRAPLGAFLTVIVQRQLSREWERLRGRWHPSAEAERAGPAAVLLEKLLVRDRRSLDEAVELVRAVDPSLDRRNVSELADRLPDRMPQPRIVPLVEEDHRFVSPDAADARASDADARRISEQVARVVRETIGAQSAEDRLLLRLHFGAGMSVADAARRLGVPQRPLYRRIEALLRQLRAALDREKLAAGDIAGLISAGALHDADFGLGDLEQPFRP
jgi:RNA polymerase sigma factor (sigma-70 family)